jgi:hypothetical protein
MTIFISWSGERSKAVAIGLRSFLLAVNAQWKPWTSQTDITAGKRWRDELADSIDSATSAVVCISAATLGSAWVQFETGALSIACSRVCPYLIGVPPSDVQGPLKEFQAKACDRQGTLELAQALNESMRKPLSAGALAMRVEKAWPMLAAAIEAAPADAPEPIAPEHCNRLDEIGLLNLLRIHFHAMANRLTHVIRQGLDEFDQTGGSVNFELLVVNVQRVVDEGRSLLEPFGSDTFGPVSAFLDQCLPPAELEARLHKGLKIVAQGHDRRHREAAAYQMIQKEQAELERRIRARLEAPRLV